MRRRRAWMMVGGAILTLAALVTVFPTRTLFTQHSAINNEQQRLALLQSENSELAARVKKLRTDAEIERIAREQYNLVRPGEEAYALLPGPEEDTAEAVPVEEKDERGFWSKLGDRVTFWN